MYHRAIVIVNEEWQGTANQVAKEIDPVGGELTFGPIYYDKDDSSLRSYGCNWQWIDRATRDAFVQGLIDADMVEETDFGIGDYADPDPATEPTRLDDLLDLLNLRREEPSDVGASVVYRETKASDIIYRNVNPIRNPNNLEGRLVLLGRGRINDKSMHRRSQEVTPGDQ